MRLPVIKSKPHILITLLYILYEKFCYLPNYATSYPRFAHIYLLLSARVSTNSLTARSSRTLSSNNQALSVIPFSLKPLANKFIATSCVKMAITLITLHKNFLIHLILLYLLLFYEFHLVGKHSSTHLLEQSLTIASVF